MNQLIPITEAKARLNELVRDAETADVLLLRHGRPAAVLVGMERYEALLEELEDLADRLSVYESSGAEPDLRIGIEKVKAELGLA